MWIDQRRGEGVKRWTSSAAERAGGTTWRRFGRGQLPTHHQILQSEYGVLEGFACPGDHLLGVFEDAFLRERKVWWGGQKGTRWGG
jgi:hypothetical protein